jgi:hypothetical protein
MMAIGDQQQSARDRIWERVRERVSLTKADSNFFFPARPNYFDVNAFSVQLLEEFPGSGLEPHHVAVEFHKMWRIARDREV